MDDQSALALAMHFRLKLPGVCAAHADDLKLLVIKPVVVAGFEGEVAAGAFLAGRRWRGVGAVARADFLVSEGTWRMFGMGPVFGGRGNDLGHTFSCDVGI